MGFCDQTPRHYGDLMCISFSSCCEQFVDKIHFEVLVVDLQSGQSGISSIPMEPCHQLFLAPRCAEQVQSVSGVFVGCEVGLRKHGVFRSTWPMVSPLYKFEKILFTALNALVVWVLAWLKGLLARVWWSFHLDQAFRVLWVARSWTSLGCPRRKTRWRQPSARSCDPLCLPVIASQYLSK